MTSSDAGSEPENLREVLKEKEKWVLIWSLVNNVCEIPNDLTFLYYFFQYRLIPRVIIHYISA